MLIESVKVGPRIVDPHRAGEKILAREQYHLSSMLAKDCLGNRESAEHVGLPKVDRRPVPSNYAHFHSGEHLVTLRAGHLESHLRMVGFRFRGGSCRTQRP